MDNIEVYKRLKKIPDIESNIINNKNTLNEVEYNIKDFGCKCDGVADDTEALEKCIKQLSNFYWKGSKELTFQNIKSVKLKIPRGITRITRTIFLPPYITLEGECHRGYNHHNSKFDFTKNGSVIYADFDNKFSFILDSSPFDDSGNRLSGINTHVNGPTTSTYDRIEGINLNGLILKGDVLGGINMKCSPCSHLENIMILGADIGVYLESNWCTELKNVATFTRNYGVVGYRDVNNLKLDRCYIDHYGGSLGGGLPTTEYNNSTLDFIYGIENTVMPGDYVSLTTGLYLRNVWQMEINSCSIQYWQRGVVDIRSNVTYNDCWFELIRKVDVHNVHGSVVFNNCRKETNISKMIRNVGSGITTFNNISGSSTNGDTLADWSLFVDYKDATSKLIINNVKCTQELGVSSFISEGFTTYSSNVNIKRIYKVTQTNINVGANVSLSVGYPSGFDRYNTMPLMLTLTNTNGVRISQPLMCSFTSSSIIFTPTLTNSNSTMELILMKIVD